MDKELKISESLPEEMRKTIETMIANGQLVEKGKMSPNATHNPIFNEDGEVVGIKRARFTIL